MTWSIKIQTNSGVIDVGPKSPHWAEEWERANRDDNRFDKLIEFCRVDPEDLSQIVAFCNKYQFVPDGAKGIKGNFRDLQIGIKPLFNRIEVIHGARRRCPFLSIAELVEERLVGDLTDEELALIDGQLGKATRQGVTRLRWGKGRPPVPTRKLEWWNAQLWLLLRDLYIMISADNDSKDYWLSFDVCEECGGLRPLSAHRNRKYHAYCAKERNKRKTRERYRKGKAKGR